MVLSTSLTYHFSPVNDCLLLVLPFVFRLLLQEIEMPECLGQVETEGNGVQECRGIVDGFEGDRLEANDIVFNGPSDVLDREEHLIDDVAQ